MSEPSPAPGHAAWLDRKRSRRAVLAGSAALAATGAAGAVLLATRGGGTASGAAETSESGAPPTATATPARDLARVPIADPRARAAHLLRRAGFGGTIDEIDTFAALSPVEAANRLVDYAATPNDALDTRVAASNFNLDNYAGGLAQDMQRWWMTRMAYSARPLEERLTFTWHGLLTSQISKVGNQRMKLLVGQNELFRSLATARYDELLQAVSKDPAMLFYLDTVESTREHPNENYARELMELFSMGVGNYTEDDVREAARAFTGWRVTPPPRPTLPADATQQQRNQALREASIAWQPEFLFVARQHDSGGKTFLGRTGTFGGEEVVAIIMEQPATGRYITRRLFTELANADPEPNTLTALEQTWQDSDHSIAEVVRAILVSDEFNSMKSYRAKVRSPIEFIVGMVRGLELETDFRSVAGQRGRPNTGNRASLYRSMDQVLFEPHNVAGWPGGETWLSSSTFFARMNFLDEVLFPGGRPIAIPALAGSASTEEAVQRALDGLVDGQMEPAARTALVAHAASITSTSERDATIAYLVLASPEYQLV